MNGYGRLSEIQAQLAGVGSADLIDKLVAFRDEASRDFDRETSRHFYTLNGTRYYCGDGSAELWLWDDVISVTSLKVAVSQDAADAGTFATTLVEDTDWVFWPRNATQDGQPYRAIRLLGSSANLTSWPIGTDNIQIVGAFGYSEEWESTGLTGTVGTTTGVAITASASAAGVIDPGDVLKIGSEQIGAVASVATTTVTIEAGGRGVNGTTAATHSSAAIYVRRYPRNIERVVKERAVGLAWDSQGGYRTAQAMGGEMGSNREAFGRWMRTVRNYHNPAAVL